MNRREFIKGAAWTGIAACAGAAGAEGAAGERPVLRVGIVSDSQGYPYKEDWGFHNLERAFEVLAKKGIDVLVNAGDIVDGPEFTAEGLRYVQGLERKWFGECKPVDVACLGNHELGFAYKNDRAKADANIRAFAEIYGHGCSNLVHKTVKGYDFISYSCYEDVGYDAAAIAEIRAALDKAKRRDGTKPIFVVTHFHPTGTCIDSDSRRGESLTELFSAYPQVVSLSGHTHCPLQDERAIWQGAFTAIETSTLSYGCMPVEYANECACLIPWGRESVGFMVAEVYGDRVEIRRYQAEDQKEMKPSCVWTVDVPYRPEAARYTEELRKAKEARPVFPSTANFLFRYDYGYVYFVVDQAHHPDFVHHYRLALTELDKDGNAVGETKSWKYLGNFYRYERNRDSRLLFKAMPHAMKCATRYRAQVYPVANFGTEGEPLTMDITVRDCYGWRNDGVPVPYPQE